MKKFLANPDHEVVYQELVALAMKHADAVSKAEILAIASNMLGKLIALQDQRVVDSAAAMEIVTANLKAGNAQAIAEIQQTKGSA